MREIVIAAPGSGKTTYISTSVSKMCTEGLPEEEIYAVTFTRSAAEEMRHKIGKPGLKIGTIHSLAYSVTTSSFSIEDEVPRTTIYDDMLADATKMLQMDHILPISMIAVDEAQDLSPLQYNFLREICKRADHILIVEDPYQSIFSFQRSDPQYATLLAKEFSLNEVSMRKSYRLPSEITSFVNRVFPDANIEYVKTGGEVEVVETDYKGINPAIKGHVIDAEGTCGVLFRTNAEILRFMESVSKKDSYNYVIPLSEHPYVSVVATLAMANHGIEPQLFANAAEFFGIDSWMVKRMLTVLNSVYVKGMNMTLSVLEDICESGAIYTGSDVPLLVPVAKKYMRIVVTILKDLLEEGTVSTKIPQIIKAIDRIGRAGYNIDELWNVPKEALAEAIKRKMLSHGETFYTINNKANTTISTVHAAKGREYDLTVVAINPWLDLRSEEEYRIVYVALTRAIKKLVVVLPMKEIVKKKREGFSVIDSLTSAIGVI